MSDRNRTLDRRTTQGKMKIQLQHLPLGLQDTLSCYNRLIFLESYACINISHRSRYSDQRHQALFTTGCPS